MGGMLTEGCLAGAAENRILSIIVMAGLANRTDAVTFGGQDSLAIVYIHVRSERTSAEFTCP
jgi:hypothetical protein